MTSLFQHVGWLLLTPEPKEEQRGQIIWPLLFAPIGVLSLAVSAYDYLVDGVSNSFTQPFMGLFFLSMALLYALPEYRHRVTVGVRLALTLTVLAFATALFLTFAAASDHAFGAGFALVLLLAMFCINYFVNRHRSRSERGSAA